MDEQYRRVKKIFLEVCDLDESARAAGLDAACGSDAELRAAVEELLRQYDLPDEAETQTVAAAARSTVRADESRRALPKQIGRARVIREIGRGGMGVVYLGVIEDTTFKRRVAIKLLKRGMDTDEVLRRFELERQILAAMNHPNIARLYDAGQTGDGRPYYVMEFVEGQTLDTYCDTRRLTIPERLDIFRSICSAVQYAHSNLIVHRDLKPTNVIVTKEGVPKLLDFGIAKILNPDMSLIAGDPTAPEFRIMTPEYASPEQVRGEPITTASDTYSLGVILYELVCGHRPYRIRSRIKAELERIICDEDPERPSTAISTVEEVGTATESGVPSTRSITPESVSKTRGIARPDRLQKRLAGDIDNIVLMAMRKEPQRRYDSVEQFSEDIRRHLNDLPVIARKDNLSYRTGKFVRRNRAGVAIAALVVLLLSAAAIGTLVTQRLDLTRAELVASQARADSEAAKAAEEEQRRMLVEERAVSAAKDRIIRFTDSLLRDLYEAVAPLPGALEARDLIGILSEEYLRELEELSATAPGLRTQVALTYDRMGEWHGSVRNPSTGDLAAAIERYEQSIALCDDILADDPDDDRARLQRAMTRIKLADMVEATGAAESDPLELRMTSLEEIRSLYTAGPEDETIARDFAVALLAFGSSLAAEGKFVEAERYYRESMEIRQRLVVSKPDDVMIQRDLSVAHLRLGGNAKNTSDPELALTEYGHALVIRQKLADRFPDSNRYRRDLAVVHVLIGDVELAVGRAGEAVPHFEAYSTLSETLARLSPSDSRARRDAVYAHQRMGDALLAVNDLAGAEVAFKSFHEGAETLVADFPSILVNRRLLASSYDRLARVAVQHGDPALAREYIAEATTLLVELAEQRPNSASIQNDLSAVRAFAESIGG